MALALESPWTTLSKQFRGSIVVSISACHAEDQGLIPSCGVLGTAWVEERGGRRRSFGLSLALSAAVCGIVFGSVCGSLWKCLLQPLGVSAAVSKTISGSRWACLWQSLELFAAVYGNATGSLWGCLQQSVAVSGIVSGSLGRRRFFTG